MLVEDLRVEVIKEFNKLVILLEGVRLEEVDEISEGDGGLLLDGFD